MTGQLRFADFQQHKQSQYNEGDKSMVQLMSMRSCFGQFCSYNRILETICIHNLFTQVPKVGEGQHVKQNSTRLLGGA